MRQRTMTGTRRPRGTTWRGLVLAVAACVCIASNAGLSKVKVRVQSSPSFDFKQARTWGWSPDSAGQVVLARTANDDPGSVQQRIEPVIKEAVDREMPRRGLRRAPGTPDLTLTYYVLVTIGAAAQVQGQFLPAVAQWGLPFFSSSTTALETIEQGSLVLDLSANGQVVWRGVGEAKLKMDLSEQKRMALVREAVADILERYPPKR